MCDCLIRIVRSSNAVARVSLLLLLLALLAGGEDLSGQLKLGPQEWALLSIASIDTSLPQEEKNHWAIDITGEEDLREGIDLQLHLESGAFGHTLETFLMTEHAWPFRGYGSTGPHACSTLGELCMACDKPDLSCKRAKFYPFEGSGPLHGLPMFHDRMSLDAPGKRSMWFLVISSCGCTYSPSPVYSGAVVLHWQASFKDHSGQHVSGDMRWVSEFAIVASILTFWVSKQKLKQHTGLQLTALVDGASNVMEFIYLAVIVLSGYPMIILLQLAMFLDSVAYALLCSFCMLQVLQAIVPELAGLGAPIMLFGMLILLLPALYDEPWSVGIIPLYAQRRRVDGRWLNWASCTMWMFSIVLTLLLCRSFDELHKLCLWAAMELAFLGRHMPRLLSTMLPMSSRPAVGAAVRLVFMAGTYMLLLCAVSLESGHVLGRPGAAGARAAEKISGLVFGKGRNDKSMNCDLHKKMKLPCSAQKLCYACMLLAAVALAIAGFTATHLQDPPFQQAPQKPPPVAAQESSGYHQFSNVGGCGTPDGTYHERCHCMKLELDFCREQCDKDAECKGYVSKKGTVNSCQYATTSACAPECGKHDPGKIGPIASAPGNNYGGCYVKAARHGPAAQPDDTDGSSRQMEPPRYQGTSTVLPAIPIGLPTSPQQSFPKQALLVLRNLVMGNHNNTKAQQTPQDQVQQVAQAAAAVTPGSAVRVCFCSDEKDLRPVAAAISSILQRTANQSRVFFHVVTSPERQAIVDRQLRGALPNARITTHSNSTLQAQIASLIAFRKTSGTRKALQSPFNFAPFYLDAFLNIASGRLVYLDTDVILQGDVIELHEVNLNGKPVGTVKDCSQRFETYIDIAHLKKLGMRTVSRNSCVFNRGVFVVDVAMWRKLRLTKEIERWMSLYKNSENDLYKFGMSQPPWLLAVHGRYQNIGPEWNCRGLGRELLAEGELVELQKQGMDLKNLGVKRVSTTHHRPFVAQCTAQARLLHFNGPLKPWKDKPRDRETRLPKSTTSTTANIAEKPSPALCALPSGHTKAPDQKLAGGVAFLACSRLWWEQLSPEVEAALL